MPTVSIIIPQFLCRAAGYELTADGRLLGGPDATETESDRNRPIFEARIQNGRMPAQAYYDILAVIAHNVEDRAALSLRYANSLDLDRLGTLALACKAAPNAGGVMHRLVRYQSLLTDSVRYSLDPQGKAAFLRQELLAGTGPGIVFSPEAGLAAMFRTVNAMASAPVTPALVTFRHEAPRDGHLFKDFYGCSVTFGAGANGILFSEESLATANKLGDRALSAFLTAHLDSELAELAQNPSLVQASKAEIGRVLSQGVPPMADVARKLGFSVRSLHRKLAEEGVSFQSLAEDTRREIALSMLEDCSRPLSEIAFMTGFSEQSAFNRAFKRWTGETPSRYRKSLRP